MIHRWRDLPAVYLSLLMETAWRRYRGITIYPITAWVLQPRPTFGEPISGNKEEGRKVVPFPIEPVERAPSAISTSSSIEPPKVRSMIIDDVVTMRWMICIPCQLSLLFSLSRVCLRSERDHFTYQRDPRAPSRTDRSSPKRY